MRVEIDTVREREEAKRELVSARAAAQARYEERLKFLAQVEKEYPDRKANGQASKSEAATAASDFRGIRPAIRDTFPHLKEITRDTILAQIRKVHPETNVDEKQIDTALRRLLSRGELRRIRDASNGHPAAYIATGVKGSEDAD